MRLTVYSYLQRSLSDVTCQKEKALDNGRYLSAKGFKF